MNATQRKRDRSNSIRGFKYSVEGLDFTNPISKVDNSTKGEYAKAAQILLREYVNREATRNVPSVITEYNEQKTRFTGIDAFNAGREPFESTPPSDWPLSEQEWVNATTYSVLNVLDQALAYGLYEKERLTRQHRKLHDYGVNSLENGQVERLEKTRAKERAINKRNWRIRMKDTVRSIDGQIVDNIVNHKVSPGVVELGPTSVPFADFFPADTTSPLDIVNSSDYECVESL